MPSKRDPGVIPDGFQGIFDRYCYVAEDDSFFDRVSRCAVSRQTFDSLFRHYRMITRHSETPRMIKPSCWYDENRPTFNSVVLDSLIFAPGGAELIEDETGRKYGNTWINARPKAEARVDITPWLDHCRKLIPDDVQLQHVLNWMAWKRQNVTIKINHAILHGGTEGCGKDTLWHPWLWSIGGDSRNNIGLLSGTDVYNKWGYQLRGEVVILNELREATDHGNLAEQFKPILASPPSRIVQRIKYAHDTMIMNLCSVLAYSNHDDCLALDPRDRRWMCIWSDAPRMTESEANDLWAWYAEGGLPSVAAFLQERDVSKFSPYAPPMITPWKLRLQGAHRRSHVDALKALIASRRYPFNMGIAFSPFEAIVEASMHVLPGALLSQWQLVECLKQADWEDAGPCEASDMVGSKRVIVAPWFSGDRSKSALRRLAEGGLREDRVIELRR